MHDLYFAAEKARALETLTFVDRVADPAKLGPAHQVVRDLARFGADQPLLEHISTLIQKGIETLNGDVQFRRDRVPPLA